MILPISTLSDDFIEVFSSSPKVITDIMVATAESEQGCGGILLWHLEMKARDCKEIMLMHIGREMGGS